MKTYEVYLEKEIAYTITAKNEKEAEKEALKKLKDELGEDELKFWAVKSVDEF